MSLKNKKVFLIRQARIDDAIEIHNTHRRSIVELCSQDYSKVQIRAWAERPANYKSRMQSIKRDPFYVVEMNGRVEGFGHMTIREENGKQYAFLWGLYFTPKAQGLGAGRKIIEIFEQICRDKKLNLLKLQSTRTSKKFYEKMGFQDDGETSTSMRNVKVECFCMSKKII